MCYFMLFELNWLLIVTDIQVAINLYDTSPLVVSSLISQLNTIFRYGQNAFKYIKSQRWTILM